MTDFLFRTDGSVWTVYAVSTAAKELAETLFPVESWQGHASAFHTDWRTARVLANQLGAEGWNVKVV